MNRIVLGFAPTRRSIFSAPDAVKYRGLTAERLRELGVEFVDIDDINEEGLLYSEEDRLKILEKFRAAKVDGLFRPHCNFGTEYVCARLAKRLGVPVLLWGPLDERPEPDGVRLRDTQCGLFAISKQLRRNGVKFSYIENCDLGDRKFTDGMEKFLRVATMVRNFKDMRILQVGTRIKPFKSIMYNELELCEKFGVDITPVNLADAVQDLTRIYDEQQPQLNKDLKWLKETYDCGTLDDVYLKKMLAIVYYYKELAEKNNCNIISSECWTGITVGWGANPCLAMSILADQGVYVTCEWDIHMTITNILLLSATRGKGVPIQGEFTCRHPENDNAELLWHCGPFALSAKAEGEKPYLYNTKPSFRLADGEYTIARFQADAGKYYLFCDKFTTTDGPKTFGTYMWAQFKNLPALERSSR